MAILSYALTTTDRLKDYLGITTTAVQTIVMENIINAVTGYIESYCGRRFQETSYVEKYDGVHGTQLVLQQYPVNSRSAFTLEGYKESLGTWETIDTDDYFVKYAEGVVGFYRGNFISQYQQYQVTYTAGYSFNNTTTFLGDTTAGDVEMVCWIMAGNIWKNKNINSNITSERIGDYAVSFGGNGFSMFGLKDGNGNGVSFEQTILDKYKRYEDETYLTKIDALGVEEDE